MKDYFKLYIEYCNKLCFENDYNDKKKLKAHNASMEKLEILHREMLRFDCSEIMLELLRYDDERVRLNAAAFCIKNEIHPSLSRKVLLHISEKSSDASLGFSAKMVLKTMG